MGNYYTNLGKRNRQRSKRRNFLFLIFTVIIVAGLIAGYLGYRMFFKPNIWLDGKESIAINIKSGSTWDDVKKMLYKNGTIVQRESFEQMAEIMKYPALIKPGHYVITEKMTNRKLLTKLR